jgi:hypothetical protein
MRRLCLGILKPFVFLTFVLSSFAGPSAFAAFSPVALDILPPLQFPPDDFSITGVRLSALWGSHRNVYGFDFGVVGNVSQVEFAGIAVSGVFNMTKGTTTAIGTQFAGIANINSNKTTVIGLQIAGLANLNQASSSVVGVQFAVANLANFTQITGLQVGLYNRAQDVRGLQIGLVNRTDNLHGLQIGVVNFNAKGPFAVSPILNVGF